MTVIAQSGFAEAGSHAPVGPEGRERAARRTLRAQIAKLERELSAAVAGTFPNGPVIVPEPRPVPAASPRLLDLGELEQVRDDLAERLRRAGAAISERLEFEAANRLALERMLLEPERHAFETMPVRDLGGRGCGVYRVRPRLGPIGMLRGWWRVTLSSGCPLPGGRGGAPRPGSTLSPVEPAPS